MPPKKSPGDARKDIKHAAIHGEEIEKTQEFWEWSDAIKYEAVTKRGTIFKETDNGKKAVESALDRLLVPFAEIAGWRTLDAIPQGRELATRFRGQLRDVMAQALASSKQLNEGYGLQAPPESETPSNTYGQVEADGLLTPGSSPKSAIDVDNVDGVVRNNNIRRGSLYEEKLRMASTNYRLAHHNDALKPFHLLCYKLLWTFKKSAQQAGIWNVFSHSVDSKMPFDDPDVRPTRIYVGGLVRSFCPLGISPDFIRGLDNDAVTGWLFSHTIELLYKWTRPEPLPGQPYYLPASCTRLLESNIQQELRLSNHSLEQLYQDLRAKKPVDMERWTDIVDWHVFRVPADATRVFFFCNPGAAANHWIVVAGDIVRMDNGGRSGKITIYDSLGRDIARADALTLQKFFYVISGIEDSTLYGIDWMSAPVVSGPSCQQDNGQDCGLFALDNLSALAHGREPSHLSPVTALDRRQGYMSRTLSIVSEISGITIPDPEAGDGGTGDSTNGSNGNQDDLSRDLRAVLEMVERFTLAHWQYMIVQAQPHLANDFAGQRANIQRLYPRILERELDTTLGPVKSMTLIPDNALPRAALVLNDHDINMARPNLYRKPRCIAIFLRNSRYSKNGLSLATAERMLENHIATSYPGCVRADFQEVHFIFIENCGSNENFLTLQQDGQLHCSVVSNDLLEEQVRPLLNCLSDLNETSSSEEHGLVDFLQLTEEGSTTRPRTLRIISDMYSNVDIRICIMQNYSMHARQPVDGAFQPDHSGRYSWAYYWARELAARAEADQFAAIGPHLDAHNQMAYLMKRIGEYKADGAGTLKTAVKERWPLESLMSGHGRLSLDSRRQPWARWYQIAIGTTSGPVEGTTPGPAEGTTPGPAEGTTSGQARTVDPRTVDMIEVPPSLHGCLWPLLHPGPVDPRAIQYGIAKKCAHSDLGCIRGQCDHMCCWGYSSAMHFAHAHGQDVTEKDFFSDARNFVQPPYVYDVKTSVRKAVLEKIANNLGLQFKRSSTKVDLMKIIWACLLFDSGNNGQPASDS